MAIRIILFQGEEKLSVVLEDGKYVVGRDDRAEIIIPNPTVSTRHAEIAVNGDEVTVSDLGSSNGSFINGTRLEGSTAIRISPSDDIQFGSARVAIEVDTKRTSKPVPPTEKMAPASAPAKPDKAPAPEKKTSPPPPPPPREAQPAKAVPEKARKPEPKAAATVTSKGKFSWVTRFWLAGAFAVVVVMILAFFMALYADSQDRRARVISRYETLAAQYVHVLKEDLKTIPAPVVDRNLLEPVRIIDQTGRILYPASLDSDGNPRLFSPLIDPETSRVRDLAKVGLMNVQVPVEGGEAVSALSFPIRSAGDFLGYVVAKPARVPGKLGFRFLTLLISAVIALITLSFAIQGPVKLLRSQLELLSQKIAPLAAGFVESLPRNPNVPEIDVTASEIEKAVRRLKTSGSGEKGGATKEEASFGAELQTLVDSSGVPFCFIGGDFEILGMSDEFRSVREFASARKGESIFDTDLSNVQSKQVVSAITDAKEQDEGRATVRLSKSGSTNTYHITAKYFTQGGKKLFGILFLPETE